MINVLYKRYGIRINAIWFCGGANDSIDSIKADLIFFHGVNNTNFKNSIIGVQHTLITNLYEDIENLFKRINKNSRYEINRAKREGIEFNIFNSNALLSNRAILNRFKNDYLEFISLKGIKNTYNESALESYIKNDNLIITLATLGEEVFAQHVYVCDDRHARLLYSVSNFRTESTKRDLIGRANKYLHWKDIEFFQENNYKNLDWGGISSVANPNGVDQFKLGFGGSEKKYYNIIVGKSLIGRLVIFLKKLKEGNYVPTKIR